MKLLHILVISLTLSSCGKEAEAPTCGLVEDTNSSPKTVKVLFIGNSHTYVNNVPKTVSLLAKSNGDSVYYEMSAPGGYDFERHYILEETVNAIKAQEWDFVVLQESGWRTALSDEMAQNMIYPYADTLCNMIKSNYSASQIVYYMTHGYKNGANWCNQDPTVCTYKGMQNNIKRTYLSLSSRTSSSVAPAGAIWNIYMDKYGDNDLYNSDNYHANPKGSYISACTIYSVILNKKPKGYKSENVTVEDADRIQNTVTNVLFNCNPNWLNY